MKVLHKTEVSVNSIEEVRQGLRKVVYGAYVTIETDDEELHDALLEAILQVEENLR